IKIYLFQGLPKSDKLELIIQKTVELGVTGIIPVEMNRSIVKLDEKKKSAKRERWQAIAESAAKQSKRNIIPEIFDVMTYKQAMEKVRELDLLLVPYENENGMKATADALSKIKVGSSVGILIGPEGGFEDKEVAQAIEEGGISISLGSRILRTETAAIASVGMCMLYAEMNL
ncbi:MAG: RNA methyltransferase, partial [Clostridia bacterium]|nr:RNA methyltransferase [Clostridia bacterium]